jgi:MFS family permease
MNSTHHASKQVYDSHDVDGSESEPFIPSDRTESQYEASTNRPALGPSLSTQARRPSFIDEEEPIAQASTSNGDKDGPVTWSSLPQKSQLAVLTLARLAEPLSERSLSAYMFYQLRWFDPSAPDSTIASQGGIMTAAFAAAQFVTAVWWGRAADTPWIGRKNVILIGLIGGCISTIGIGFSKSFAQALVFRTFAGALNGNIGVMRTMISEIIKEKKFQSRAFLLLPMCFNVGVVIGPIMGGFLADPISSFPGVFGPGSSLGGKDGVGWMKAFPYALPNIISACILGSAVIGVVLSLDETHIVKRHKPDYGRRLGKTLARVIFGKKDTHEYSRLRTDDTEIEIPDTPLTPLTPHTPNQTQSLPNTPTRKKDEVSIQRPPMRSILTRNVLLTLLTHHLLALHVSTFNALIFILLPAPISPNKSAHLPFLFTGGLGLTTEQVGLATAIIGVIGLPLQLLLYPRLQDRLGTLTSYRIFLPMSIFAYAFIPFLSLLPSSSLPKWLLWPFLTVVLGLQVLSRTFALPSTAILCNNSSPSPMALGTVHGLAQSISSGGRTMGPVVGGWVLGWGLRQNCVGAVWWGMAAIAFVNWGLIWTLYEGDGKGGRA